MALPNDKYFVKFRRPVRVDETLTVVLRARLRTRGVSIPEGWQLFVTDTKRGRTSYKSKTVTVPTWAMETDPDGKPNEEYQIYYACHEIAHVYTPNRKGDVHGSDFMRNFIRVCPEEFLHYELGYKPRLAAAAGIRKNER